MKICIQAGHSNKGGGAPNELATNKRIADRLSAILRERKFEVVQTDYYAYNDPVVTKNDYNLFLSLHCDMDYPNDGGSGFADYPKPNTDGATIESQRICKVINDFYFPEVKINYINRSNANTRYYYMWKYLTFKTPCVLLEMGQSIDPHDSVLLANTELIASAIGRAICKAFNVSYEIAPNTPTCEEQLNLKNKEIADLKVMYENVNKALIQAKLEFGSALADKDIECQEKIDAYKKKIIYYVNNL